MITTLLISTCTYAQTDTINKRMMPPEINNTDGLNKTEWNNSNNQRGTIDNSPNNDQTPTTKDKNVENSTISIKADKNKFTAGCIMQNGKMMNSIHGKLTPMKKSYTYPNGTIINTYGTYLSPKGKKIKLKNEQYLDNSGKIISIN